MVTIHLGLSEDLWGFKSEFRHTIAKPFEGFIKSSILLNILHDDTG